MTPTPDADPAIVDPPPSSPRPVAYGHADLFLISFAILFFELAAIRWFASTVVYLTFFTNWVLLACTIGTAVGCLAARKPSAMIRTTIPITWGAVTIACAILYAYQHSNQFRIDVGGQSAPQEVFFGTEHRLEGLSKINVPIELIAGLFYALIAVIFLGPGQVLGRALASIPGRTSGYTTNLLGSLAGIAAFAAASWLRIPPVAWFVAFAFACFYFVRPWTMYGFVVQASFATLMFILVVMNVQPSEATTWSPYYKIGYNPRIGAVSTNNIVHQWILDVQKDGPEYSLPHLLNRDAGGEPFGDVLIIGAGTGNDVQAALHYGARHVDAVEVDPVLYEIGRGEHPGRPYDDPRVTVHLDDGRNFLRRTDRRYDLVIYALVDSLVLHSSYSNLRLESYLFTEQAFRDVRSRLKPSGVFAMYNYYRWGWVVGRLQAMATLVFGAKPVVMPLNSGGAIRPDDPQGGITLLMAGAAECPALDAIRRSFHEAGFFWANRRPSRNATVRGYGPEPPDPGSSNGDDWQKIATAEIFPHEDDRLPSDSWPFLYLREPMIPALYLRGMALAAGLSIALLVLFSPGRRPRLDAQMFFLGAGFMLLETRGVAQMALLFGSTWIVSSVVFAAVLVMALLANLYVMVARPDRVAPYLILMIASVLLNQALGLDVYLGIPFAYRAVLACLVVFAPVAFAGVMFAKAFRDSPYPEAALGANVAGILLGGMSEYGVLVLGFDWLLLVAVLFYMLAAYAAPRTVAAFSPA